MGKKGSSKKALNVTSGPQMSVTIREASTGKKETNVKTSLKLHHIKNLAEWASRDAAIPSLGAFFGHHFASSSEALTTPVDPSLLTCQRCESILHPGYNCTIRIEKNKTNSRNKGKKATVYPQNNIVYTCHFCSHRNMKRGTPRNTSAPKAKPHPKPKPMPLLQKTGKTVSSHITKDNVFANTISAPMGSTSDDLDRGKMGILERSETLKVKDNSTDIINNLAANAIVDDPSGKIGSSDISETLEVKDDAGRGKMGILEIRETLKVKDDSADITNSSLAANAIVDDPMGKMGILEVKNDSVASVAATPLVKSTLTLLESKMRKRNRSGAKKTMASESNCVPQNAEKAANNSNSNRRKRKSWTSLKEIAESNDNENSRRFMNLTVPFSMQ